MTERNKKILVGVLLCLYCFAFQGSRGLFEPDEGRYSAVALQMLKTGDFIIPHTHPQIEHWTKPPLTYWAIATHILIFGKNEFAVRFLNAMSFLLTIVISFFLGKVFLTKQPWLPALIFGTFFFTATMCNGATTDYLLMMWESLAVLFFARGYWGKQEDVREVSIWLMWAAFGFGFLTKGPVALLPLASILLFLYLRSESSTPINMHYRRGTLLMLLIGAGWYVLAITIKFELLGYFLWEEIFLRFFTDHAQRHPHWYSFIYIYIPVLIVGSLPWSWFAVKGMWRCFKPAHYALRSLVDDGGRGLFIGLWFCVSLVFFMLSRSNLPLYVLPLFVPFALAAARQIHEKEIELKPLRPWIIGWCLVIILIRPVMANLEFRKDARRYAQKLESLAKGDFDEIIFVNTPPALGLTLYTGADVRSVDLSYEDWYSQLRPNKSRLWFVVQAEALGFTRAVRMKDISMRELGPLWGREEYVVYKEIASGVKNPFGPPIMY